MKSVSKLIDPEGCSQRKKRVLAEASIAMLNTIPRMTLTSYYGSTSNLIVSHWTPSYCTHHLVSVCNHVCCIHSVPIQYYIVVS